MYLLTYQLSGKTIKRKKMEPAIMHENITRLFIKAGSNKKESERQASNALDHVNAGGTWTHEKLERKVLVEQYKEGE